MNNIKKIGLVFSLTGLLVATGCNKSEPSAKGIENKAKVESKKENKENKEAKKEETKDVQKSDKSASIKELKGEELEKIMNDAQLKEKYLVIDVRDISEYESGHVKTAINIDVNELEKRLVDIESYKNKEIVTICNSGNRSKKAAEILVDNGFTKVNNAQGVKEYKYSTMTNVANVLGARFQELVDTGEYYVVDARDAKDFEESHLQGAMNITLDKIDAGIKNIPQDSNVLVYCYTGDKSFEVAQKLAEKGYKVINSLDGTEEYKNFSYDK